MGEKDMEKVREEIARIIDPWSLNQCEWAVRQDDDDVLREYLPKREAALAKADTILKLPALSAPVGGEEEQGVAGVAIAREGPTASRPEPQHSAGWADLIAAEFAKPQFMTTTAGGGRYELSFSFNGPDARDRCNALEDAFRAAGRAINGAAR